MPVKEIAQCEIIDHNIAAGYVTYIVDLWDGDRTDPAVGVTRYIGVFRGEELEDEDGFAFDPQYRKQFSNNYTPVKPEALVWEQIETTKKADRSARDHQQNDDNLLEEEEEGSRRYMSPEARKRKELYKAFIAAIDVLAVDYDDAEAWEAVDAWRRYHAEMHEK